MTDLVRQEIAALTGRVVVKVGTRVVTRSDGQLDEQRVARLAEELHELILGGRQVALVSSGAVGAGLSRLGWHERPRDLARLQAVAAIGQARLIEAYDRQLKRHGRHAAQVLLTVDDLDDRARYLNVRNTLLTLLQLGAVPIINENDTVAVDELMTTFGDNDRLAAVVANLLQAPLLIILSDVDGLYDGPPSASGSRVISVVDTIDAGILSQVRRGGEGVSKGGMASKLEAARMLTRAGENVIIASGHRDGVLAAIFAGQQVGTLFVAQGKSISPWKRWIGFSAQSRGRLVVDAGACRAIREQGRSLLPIGVVSSEGDFAKGDIVSVHDTAGREVARGLTNYRASELAAIAGRRSDQIAQILGHRPYDEVIHRDNMVLTGG